MSRREEDQLDDSDDEYIDKDYLNCKRFKNSLDSDEEDDEEKSKKEDMLDPEELEGQEEATIDYDDGIKITPFNMSEELEEGHFDKEGTFIFKREKDNIKDHWLDNIDWVKIKVRKNKEEEISDEEEEPINKIEVYEEMLKLMKPGETVRKAICRMGGGKTSYATASNKWKRKRYEEKSDDIENTKKEQEKLLNLTSLANKILLTGEMDIYEQLYERLNFLIKQSKNEVSIKPAYETNSEALDMFSDSIDDKVFSVADNVRQDNSTKNNVDNVQEDNSTNNNVDTTSTKADDEVMWEFKWENEESAAIYGPHPSSEMLRWVEEGYFEKGVWVRKAGQNSDFYNSQRIDFDLYV